MRRRQKNIGTTFVYSRIRRRNLLNVKDRKKKSNTIFFLGLKARRETENTSAAILNPVNNIMEFLESRIQSLNFFSRTHLKTAGFPCMHLKTVQPNSDCREFKITVH